MQAHFTNCHMRPTVALADYDFLRATYDMLQRAPVPDPRAIDAAFAALDAAHARLKAAHLEQSRGLQQKMSPGHPHCAEDLRSTH